MIKHLQPAWQWPRTLLITGATDGLGLALARYYHACGKRLILIGRRPLTKLSDPLFSPTTYCQLDVARPDCASHLLTWLQAADCPPLDGVIHNAGVGYYGSIASQSAESIATLMAVNLLAPMRLTHALLPHMATAHVEEGGIQYAKIILISSVVARLAGPDYAVYGATKAALDGFGRSLRLELAGQMAVQIIHPGAMRTGMHAKSGLPRTTIDWTKFPPAERVARQIAYSILSHRSDLTIGLGNIMLSNLGYYFGSWLDAIQRKRIKR